MSLFKTKFIIIVYSVHFHTIIPNNKNEIRIEKPKNCANNYPKLRIFPYK